MASPRPANKKPCHSHLLMLPWVQTQVRELSLIFDLTLGSALHPLLPTSLFPFPPLAPQLRGAEMRSFWTESQKKKKRKKEFFLSVLFPNLKRGGGKKSLLPPPSFSFPVRAPASWGYLTIAIVLVNV